MIPTTYPEKIFAGQMRSINIYVKLICINSKLSIK